MIAVHCGAGSHSTKHHVKYNKLCSKACRAGMEVIKAGGSALEAVRAAVIILENDPLSNAGYGSNLTVEGRVECDASVMNGDNLLFGGCGSVPKVKNPVALAYEICQKQLVEQPSGLVAPSLLVGSGALKHARSKSLKIVKNKDLVSPKAERQMRKYLGIVNVKLDTVGAVCVDSTGCVASACSSGGLLLKSPGRVGQAALYGCGVWADSWAKKSEDSVAVSTTGCGEHLVQTQLAKEISDDLKNCSCPVTALYSSMTNKFINSRYLHRIKEKNAGALAVHVSKTGEGTVLWGHSTESMSVGYMRISDAKPKTLISTFSSDERVKIGSTVTVGGNNFYLSESSSDASMELQA
ncbi:PREDICTED: threonine aspartase 1-like [Nicrophorus vespilloides]|uniref:Threonine aspartase 1-like n=1 Tax=Nicrophorus vespilloides TaxID=110193 RepID=A0ABM1NGA8_NICVS|nr:PREDICTED: threonine aspartase 1-like [Nicrophorus vespilloides]